MNDLISRSALLEAIAEKFFKTDPTGEEQLGYLACNRIVREFPTVDAEVVRHGKWVHDINNLFGCSECMERDTMSFRRGLKNYCPNCGAKMDAEVHDADR